jgi:hypothetical protein
MEWLGWHLLGADKRLRHDMREVIVELGKTYSCKGRLKLCETGMHASKRAIDCLEFSTGTVFCRVELIGERIDGDKKSCARKRKVLWMVDAEKILHEFTCRCAEQALDLVEPFDSTVDPRSRAAIATKRAWLKSTSTNEELAAAEAEAWSAFYASASGHAEITAQDAAWISAWAATKDAKEAAAAAIQVAGDAQNAELERMLNEAHG